MAQADAWDRRRTWSALAAILVVPLLLCGLGIWQVERAAAADGVAARLREAGAWLSLGGGAAAGIAGVAGMLLIAVSARQGRRSRPALVAGFGRVARVLLPMIAMQVAGCGLGLLGAVGFEVGGLWFGPATDDRTAMLAVVTVLGTAMLLWGAVITLRDLRRAMRAFVPAPLRVRGVALAEAEAPALHALLHDLAQEQGTIPPSCIAAGTRPGFFVTALPVLLHGHPDAGPVPAGGRTLYLPLPELATLDRTELRTVLAHELAHFSGQDTEYSLRFQPLYAGLGRAAEAMSRRDADWGSTFLVDRVLERAVHPHTVLAVHAHERFTTVVARWSRLREFEADRAAAASGSPAAAGSALLRLGATGGLLHAALHDIEAQPDIAAPDLAVEVAARLGTVQPYDFAAHLGDRIAHPTDSHPPSWQRMEALGIAVTPALLAHAGRPVDPAELAAVQALFADWNGLSRGLTGHVLEHARRRQAQHRAGLQEMAATAHAQTALHASLLRPVLGLALLGSACLAVALTCLYAAHYGGAQDRAAWRLLYACAAAGALGLGFVALCSLRLWRGRKTPFLVIDQDGVRSPGFQGTLGWLDVEAIGVSALRPPNLWFVLCPGVPVPHRTGALRRVQTDLAARTVQFSGLLPRGLDAAALRALLLRHAQAAQARQALRDAAAPS